MILQQLRHAKKDQSRTAEVKPDREFRNATAVCHFGGALCGTSMHYFSRQKSDMQM